MSQDQTKRELLARVKQENSNMERNPPTIKAIHLRRAIEKRLAVGQQERAIISRRTALATPEATPREVKARLAVSKLKPNEITWVTGVTTVPARRETTLPKTLQSLALAGFPEPRLFVDDLPMMSGTGEAIELSDMSLLHLYNNPSTPVTLRSPNIKTYGNWFLSLMELYIRSPLAHRYALFQDDIILSQGVREYLEHTEYPERGYLNLMTFPQNETERLRYFPTDLPEEKSRGWYPSNQKGKSATAFVFDRATVLDILSCRELIERFQHEKSFQNVDGAIANALRKLGYTEYVHSPSLVRHTGIETTMGPNHPAQQPQDLSFRGEDWDVMEIVRALP